MEEIIDLLKKQEQVLSETIKKLMEQRLYIRKVLALKTITKKIKGGRYESKGTN